MHEFQGPTTAPTSSWGGYYGQTLMKQALPLISLHFNGAGHSPRGLVHAAV